MHADRDVHHPYRHVLYQAPGGDIFDSANQNYLP